MKLKVRATQEVWQSEDGRVAIYQIKDEKGEVYKTRSRTIGQAPTDAEFDVVVTEEVNRFGQPERWIKQEPRMGGKEKDTASIERQVALKSAVDFANTRDQMKAKDVLTLAEEFDKFLKEGRGEKK